MKVNKAFTLIEILLVVIIIGIVLALAAPNFSKGFARFQLNQTTDDLLSMSRWAQAMAIGQELEYSLYFAHDRRSYRLERITNNSDNNDDQKNFEPVHGSLGRTHAIAENVDLEMTQVGDLQGTGNTDRIEFYPDGTIDPVTIQLTCPNQKITLSSSEMRGMMTKVENE